MLLQDVYTLNFKNYPIRAVAYFLSLFPVCTLRFVICTRLAVPHQFASNSCSKLVPPSHKRSANFPVITITLRENLRTLAHSLTGSGDAAEADTHGADGLEVGGCLAFASCHMYALVAIVPPLVVAFFTEDVSMLVGFTGAYAGLGIQWIVPTCLVYCLRRRLDSERARATAMANGSNGGMKSAFSKQKDNRNPFASPFAHVAWIYVILTCALASTVIITISHFK